MSSHVVIPVLAAFAVSLVLGPIVIPFLRKLKMKQTERVEGVQSHLKKAGTPTMGGIIILAAVIVTSLFYVKDYPKIIPVLFLTVAFGLIGFLDDYLKVVLKRSDGLMPMQKMALQIIVTAVFAFYLVKVADIPLTMLVPFSNGYYLDIGWMAVPLLFVAVIGTVNGTNFTDGLDGLASSVTVLVATFFTVVAIGTKSGIEPVTCAVVGALLGFLLFNVYPASVFMGDTGSLALGGFVASTAYMLQMPIFIALFQVLREMGDRIGEGTYSFYNLVPNLVTTPSQAFGEGFGTFVPYLILMIIFAGATFLPMVLQQLKTENTQQKNQTLMMGAIMSLMMLWISWGSPAGVLLFWGASSLIGIGQNQLTLARCRAADRRKEEEEALVVKPIEVNVTRKEKKKRPKKKR